jgi:L-cysteine/cystine lyase
LDKSWIRSQIPASENNIYLNTGWEGPSPLGVVKAVHDQMVFENEVGPTTPPVIEYGMKLEEETKSALASMVNATPDELLLTQNTTHGLNIVLNGIPWHTGDEVIILDIEYPSVMVLALHLRDTYGVTLRTVKISPTESHAAILSKIESAINDKTKLIFASHIHYLNGLRMPEKELCALAHSHGVKVLFDGAQGLVHVDLDLQDMDIDYYSMPGQKWLLGPDGIGALYIKAANIPDLRPSFVSSRAAKTWDPLGTYEVDTDSIGKFRLTTTSAPLKAGFKEALRFIQDDLGGVSVVEKMGHDLASVMKSNLSSVPNLTIHSPIEGPEATSLVTFSLSGKEAGDIVSELWRQKRIVCRAIQSLNGVRLSLHVFNTEEDINQTVAAISAL